MPSERKKSKKQVEFSWTNDELQLCYKQHLTTKWNASLMLKTGKWNAKNTKIFLIF